jgi:hypothetical protein
MIPNKIKIALILGIAIVCLSSCTKNYKCMRYKGAFDVYYNPKEQSCYYTFKSEKKNLTKETCASLCYEDL